MSPRGLLLVSLSAVLTFAANMLLRAGIDRAGWSPGGAGDVLQGLIRLAKDPVFDVGALLYMPASIVWFRVIATEPLSTAYPLLMSLTFIMVTVGAVLFFRETVTAMKLLGLVIILAGIVLVSRG
jgi:multidrug transporter EmrE-like cation transporter